MPDFVALPSPRNPLNPPIRVAVPFVIVAWLSLRSNRRRTAECWPR